MSKFDLSNELSIFKYAAEGKLELIKKIHRAAPKLLYEKTADGNTPLLLAAEGGHLKTVQWLTRQKDIFLTETNHYGHTALHLAANNGRLEMVQYLLNHNKNVIHAIDQFGYTPLHMAAFSDHQPVVEWLLDKGGASMEEKNGSGMSAFLVAAYGGALKTVEWFLKTKKALIEEHNDYGYTALLTAICSGHVDLVQWLLEDGGASLNETTHASHTPLQLAIYHKQTIVVDYLLKSTSISYLEVRQLELIKELEFTSEIKDLIQSFLKEKEALASTSIPSSFYCPITRQLILNPVIAPDGHIYEHEAIKDWLERKKTSPELNVPMKKEHLIQCDYLVDKTRRILMKINQVSAKESSLAQKPSNSNGSPSSVSSFSLFEKRNRNDTPKHTDSVWGENAHPLPKL